ncbi:hypothetical protein AB205_0123710, partial [Aquarana catesbeiana]
DTDRCTRQMDFIIPAAGLLDHTKMLDAAGTNKHW